MSQPSSPVEASFSATIEVPFGSLILRANHQFLLGIDIRPEFIGLREPNHPLLIEVCRQFRSYLANPQWSFSLPVCVQGSDFQCAVWQAMREIPLGAAWSYAQLAGLLGSSPRAVANACRANEYPILIPCHRIVSAHGIGGYCGQVSGPMIEIKRWLLRHEGYDAT